MCFCKVLDDLVTLLATLATTFEFKKIRHDPLQKYLRIYRKCFGFLQSTVQILSLYTEQSLWFLSLDQ